MRSGDVTSYIFRLNPVSPTARCYFAYSCIIQCETVEASCTSLWSKGDCTYSSKLIWCWVNLFTSPIFLSLSTDFFALLGGYDPEQCSSQCQTEGEMGVSKTGVGEMAPIHYNARNLRWESNSSKIIYHNMNYTDIHVKNHKSQTWIAAT